MSNVITFYSYKGGVGRTMSLANIAVLLSHWGHKVLMVDWDLEAPGLEHFFSGKDKEYIDIQIVKEKVGLIDLLQIDANLDWRDSIIPIKVPNEEGTNTPDLHFISSGKRDDDYFKKVRNFHVDAFYENGGGELVERLRTEWKNEYDYILIDSRTGITEIGGICTIQLPDIVVLLFTATDQGFEGILDIAKRAKTAQQSLPYERQKLVFLPVPTKFDTQAEFKLSQDWLHLFAKKLLPIYNDWLPSYIRKKEFLELTKVPYISYFSYGEKLPVIEQGVKEPTGLGYAYENIALLLANNLNNAADLMVNRKKLVADRKNNELNEIKIYISYAQADNNFKLFLRKSIKDIHLDNDIKISIWDKDMTLPGDEMEKVVSRKIEDSDVFILILSPNYFNTVFTMSFEVIKILKQSNKRIIPILYQNYNRESDEFDISMKYRLMTLDGAINGKPFEPLVDKTKEQVSEMLKTAFTQILRQEI